jgi:hypothetical protein
MRDGVTQGEGVKIEIPIYNDVWMDNGVETFYQILKEAQNNSFNVNINADSLLVNVTDFDEFKEAVGVAVKNRRSNLIVIAEDKKTGETKQVKKDYVLIQEGTLHCLREAVLQTCEETPASCLSPCHKD